MRAALTWRHGNRPLLILAGALAALAAILTFVQRPRRTDPPRVLNHIASDLRAGEILRGDDLRDAAAAGIAARVTNGERAFSIRVAEDEIVGGFLQSGDHVDVFATIPGSVFKDRAAHADRSQAVTLLQNVLVLAVGETLTTGGAVQSSARTVSLSLTPEALAKLALAQRFGKISLAIRRPGDNKVSAPAHAALADLVADPSQQTSPVNHKGAIRFYSGTQIFWRRAP